MTEIMPFPENNTLFYWTAPQASIFCMEIILDFLKKPIDIFANHVIIQKLSDTATKYGGIAQLGERLNGIQEVSGSIPLISTRKS